jgi:hypothetical protein
MIPSSSIKIAKGFIFWANVRDDGSPLAFGTQGCSTADMPEVPKA